MALTAFGLHSSDPIGCHRTVAEMPRRPPDRAGGGTPRGQRVARTRAYAACRRNRGRSRRSPHEREFVRRRAMERLLAMDLPDLTPEAVEAMRQPRTFSD